MYETVNNPFGNKIIHFAELDSTMNKAREMANDEANSGTIIIADFQNSGRGRIPGRVWKSELNSSLLFTILLSQKVYSSSFPLSLKIGWILTTYFNEEFKSNIKIKWPNDLLVNGKKISGILIESNSNMWLAGIGINVKCNDWNQIEKPAYSLEEICNKVLSRELLLKDILNRLNYGLNENISDKEWSKRVSRLLYKKSSDVEILLGDPNKNKKVVGQVESIASDGSLVIMQKEINVRRNIYSGEIIYQY